MLMVWVLKLLKILKKTRTGDMKLKHVMIDLESMGVKPDSAIVSIGAVVFDPRANKVSDKVFYTELEWEDQGRLINQETKEWWHSDKVSNEARDALYGFDDLEHQLKALAEWLPKDCKVWGNGATFDISMLEDAYDQYSIPIPWDFWNIRDMRTIKDMYESLRGGLDRKSGGTLHNALHDAIFQAEYVCEMWNGILTKR